MNEWKARQTIIMMIQLKTKVNKGHYGSKKIEANQGWRVKRHGKPPITLLWGWSTEVTGEHNIKRTSLSYMPLILCCSEKSAMYALISSVI